MSGRPRTTNFEELNFSLLKSDKKSMAYCNICKNTFQNTAISRLIAHRKRCHAIELLESAEDNNSEEITLQEIKIVDMDLSSNDSQLILAEPAQNVSFMSTENENDSSTTYQMNSPSFPSSSCQSSPSPVENTSTSLSLLPSCSSSSLSPAPPLFAFIEPSTKKISKATKSKQAEAKNRLSNFVDTITPKERKEIDSLVAKFFYGCNISLNTIESPHFERMITKLRPAYSKIIPSRKVLSTKLLDETYADVLNEARSTLNSDSVLLIDGWKNSSSNSKTVVSMIHNANGQRAFLNAWDLSGESETADKVSEIVYESIDLAKELYNTTIYAVISDNASVMIKMGKNVKHVLWHSTCNCHTGNLLAKDIIDLKQVERVNLVLKEFKNSDLENTILSKGGKRIKLACETRWCSYRDAFDNLLFNLRHIKQIIIDEKPKKVKASVSKLVFDDEFIENVKESKEMFDPICELINKCQQPDTSLADASYMWLSFNVQDKFKTKMLQKFEDRREMALNEYALSCYYLHPFYDKSLLKVSHMNKINNFLLKNLIADGLEDWHCYKNKIGFFDILYKKEIKKPEVFWSTAEMNHPALAKLALKLLNLPASSAQIERVFSNWAQIHSPLRNRLTFERSKKLIHVYFTLNGKRTDNNVWSSDDEDC